MQKSISFDGLILFFNNSDEDSVELIKEACAKSIRLIKEFLDLDPPEDCRIYIMTSWLQFYQAAPLLWRIFLTATLPFWVFRVRRLWPFVGGWEQKYGKVRTIGIKPPRLLETADRRIGERIFIKEESIEDKVRSIACHELTHAFTAHLRLPAWLKEGLAMLMVDKFFLKPTVKKNTLEMLKNSPAPSAGSQRSGFKGKDTLLYLYIRGYWRTRYISETRPDLLKKLLAKPYGKKRLEAEIAGAYRKDKIEFWNDIDTIAASHFM